MDLGAERVAREEKVHAEVLYFLPLGGLGEIGMNCFALEQDGDILLVDCGASFPDDDVGEELLVPDLRWLAERSARLTGVFITHGHEDHIGAVPHLLRTLKRKVPIYAPAHSAALIAARLSEQGIFDHDLRVVEPGQTLTVGPFEVEPIRVAHSIVEATALCIETRVGRIIHTADFDLDASQPVGWRTDEQRLRDLGRAGVRLLLSDSTNVGSELRPGDETAVARALEELVRSAPERVVVSLFASNAHRISALISAAQLTGRKICLLGRSLERHFDIARALGHLKYPSDLLVAQVDVSKLERNRALVLAGGSQGEASSALRRLAQGTHPQLQLEAGDLIVLSARVIPGHERSVFSMLNDFDRQGVTVITPASHPQVHVSGHASRGELRSMIEWTRPQSFIPVHGTLSHLKRHAELARGCGVADIQVVENGTMVAIPIAGPLYQAARVNSGVTRLVEGGAELDAPTRRRRFALGRSGVLMISVQLNSSERVVGTPKISSRGVVGVDADEGAMSVVTSSVVQAVERARGQRMQRLEETVAQAVRSVILEMCGSRPLVLVHIFPAGSINEAQHAWNER